ERHTPLHAIQNHLRKAQELRPHLLNQIYHGRPHLLSTSVLVQCQDGEVFFRFLPLPTLSYSNVTLSCCDPHQVHNTTLARSQTDRCHDKSSASPKTGHTE